MAQGSAVRIGVLQNPEPWGNGVAAVPAADDGVPINTEGLGVDTLFLDNRAMFGGGARQPGALGGRIGQAPLTTPLMYRSGELLTALSLGDVDAAALESGSSAVYRHNMRLATSHLGLAATIVARGDASWPRTKEAPHVKVGGFTITAAPGTDPVGISWPGVAHDVRFNTGSPADGDVVLAATSIPALNVVHPADAQPPQPSEILLDVTLVGLTAVTLRVEGVSIDGRSEYEEVAFTTSAAKQTATRYASVSGVRNVSETGVLGADVFKASSIPGQNNDANDTLTQPTTLDTKIVAWPDMRVYVAPRDVALDTSTELCVDSLTLECLLNLVEDSQSSCTRGRVREPGAADFTDVNLNLTTPTWVVENNPQLLARLQATHLHALVTFNGGELEPGFPMAWGFYLPLLQWIGPADSPTTQGPQEIPLNLNGRGASAPGPGTGAPAWATTGAALQATLINLNDSDLLL